MNYIFIIILLNKCYQGGRVIEHEDKYMKTFIAKRVININFCQLDIFAIEAAEK